MKRTVLRSGGREARGGGRMRDGGSGGANLWWWGAAFAAIAVLVLFSVATLVPVRSVQEQVDPVTGAERGAADQSSGEVRPTLLLTWVQRRDPQYAPDWVTVSHRQYNLFGRRLSRNESRSPAIVRLTTAPTGATSALDTLVALGSEDDIAGFVAAMRAGGSAERERVVGEFLEGLSALGE